MKQPRALLLVALLMLAAALLAGCGEKEETIGDTTARYGPGVTDGPPPWSEPEYDNLEKRIEILGLPSVGNEKYHRHALLRIYDDGRLIPVPPNVGWLPQAKVYSSIHTHEPNGVIHMESIRPHEYKLGDFFFIWGVSFGKDSLGSLRNEGGDKQLNVYVNGKRVADPPNYVLQEGDVIAIGYGADDSFPHEPDATALKNVDKGQGSCGKGDATGHQGCVDPKAETDQEGSGA
jgi:hypothetical protein